MSKIFGRMRTTMRLLLSGGCMYAALAVLAERPQARHDAGTPRIHLRVSARDLGLVDPGRDLTAEFILENRGGAPLRIHEAHPS